MTRDERAAEAPDERNSETRDEREAGARDERAAGASPDGEAGKARPHTHSEVLEFAVPEGRDSIQVRVEPEVVVEHGEQHIRVKVDDPNWMKDPAQDDSGETGTAGRGRDTDSGDRGTGSPGEAEGRPADRAEPSTHPDRADDRTAEDEGHSIG